MAPKLTVGFSCLAERAAGITIPELPDDVEVVVCIQGGTLQNPPTGARVVAVEGFGVARSRNVALDTARGRYLLFCDDDVVIEPAGVLAGVQHLERTGHAIALGRAVDPSGRPRKRYPARTKRLTAFNTAKTGTIEMLIDVAQVRSAGVRFDERFGSGAVLHLGDEYLFVVDLLRAGLTGQAIPKVFATHPPFSSGDQWDDAHVRAVVLNRAFGRLAPVARTAFALKHRHQLGGRREVWQFIADNTRPPAT